jgi:hypothetical protein
VYGQQLARLEVELLGALGELEEVTHPAGCPAELDDVAALHGGRGDLNVGCQRAARSPAAHRPASTGVEWWDAEWHGQAHVSTTTGRSIGAEAGEDSVQARCVPMRQAVDR